MGGSAEITDRDVSNAGPNVNSDDPMLGEFAEDDKQRPFFEEPEEESAEEVAETEPEEDEPDEDDTDEEDAPEDAEEDADEEIDAEEDTDTPETLASLLGLVNDLRNEISELKAGTKPDEQAQADPVAAIQPIQPAEVEVSISDDDFDELSSTKEGAQKVLSREVNKAVKSASAQAQEAVYQQLPGLITPIVARFTATQAAAQEWQSKNPDLVRNPRIVELVQQESNRVQNANPKLPPLEVFNRAGKNVRTMLKELQAKADDSGDKKPDKKPKPKGGGAKPAPKSKSKLSDAEKELLADLRPGFR